ncbi:MAG TPA: hypothetical protein GX742_03985, partial [Acholeplasmataceae bacterium]|nr:hypothetical protein [Acholeplasmataceae bacterium]
INIINKKLYIETKTTNIEILEIQAPGKNIVSVKDFLNGQRIFSDGDIVEERRNSNE